MSQASALSHWQRAMLVAAKMLRRTSLSVARMGATRALARAEAFGGLGELYDFVAGFEFAGVSIAPMQRRSEFVGLLGLVSDMKPRRVVEIGTARGGTLFALTRVSAPDAVLVGVDFSLLGSAVFGGARYFRRHGRLYRSFALPGQRVEFLFEDSHDAKTRRRVIDTLGGPIDVLFIDGDHSFEGVRDDFEKYGPLVRRGGLVAFHDIVPGPAEAVGGVPTFWQSIRTADAIELVDDWEQGGYGIGVLRM